MKCHVLTLVIISALVGCATNETHPAKVSWYDLSPMGGRDRLDGYLEDRKRQVVDMQESLSRMQSDLYQRQEKLDKLDFKLTQAAKSNRRIKEQTLELQKDINRKQVELSQAIEQLNSHKRDLDQLKSKLTVSSNNNREIQYQIAENKVEIESLEKDVLVLKRAIDRILIVRSKHALETE